MNVLATASTNDGSWMLIAGAIALFGSLFIVMGALTGHHVRRRRLAKELAGPSESSVRSQMSSLGTKATALAERSLQRHDSQRVLATALERAGIDLRAPEFAVLALGVTAAAGFGGLALGGLLPGVLGLIISIGTFTAVVNIRSSRRHKQFEDQLPDALGLIAGGLRAGHSLPQAIDALVQEAEAPTCDEFRRVLFETQLGHTLTSALRALAARVRSEDFDWVVQAIEIQREVGGDLAAVLDNVTSTIRDRTRVRRQIDTLTAEGRVSGVVLFSLPLAMFAYMAVANPAYINELTTTFAGSVMLIAGGGLLVAGGLWLRRIVRLIY